MSMDVGGQKEVVEMFCSDRKHLEKVSEISLQFHNAIEMQ